MNYIIKSPLIRLNNIPLSLYKEKKIKIIFLMILDPPDLKDCLRSITPNPVKEGEVVKFECLATGNPFPFLKCELLDYHGNVMRNQIIPANGGGQFVIQLTLYNTY